MSILLTTSTAKVSIYQLARYTTTTTAMGEESKVYIGDLDPQVEKHEVEDAFGKIGALK